MFVTVTVNGYLVESGWPSERMISIVWVPTREKSTGLKVRLVWPALTEMLD